MDLDAERTVDAVIIASAHRRALRSAFEHLANEAHPIRSAALPQYKLACFACEILALRCQWSAEAVHTQFAWWRASVAGGRMRARQMRRTQAAALAALATTSRAEQSRRRAVSSIRASSVRRGQTGALNIMALARARIMF